MNKCKGCQWYNKPYWSIINPCEHCPREIINEEIYMELPREKITFHGNTEEEKKANELLFDMGLELSALDDELKEKDKEIDRLNNIINELEKILKEEVKELYNEENPVLLDETYIKYATERKMAYMYILDKLKELKEDNK